MGGLNELDETIDASGYLRLTTLDRTTKLIGNVVTPELGVEAGQFGIKVENRVWQRAERTKRTFLQRIAALAGVRWLLQGLYNRLFWILSGQAGDWIEADTELPGSEDS